MITVRTSLLWFALKKRIVLDIPMSHLVECHQRNLFPSSRPLTHYSDTCHIVYYLPDLWIYAKQNKIKTVYLVLNHILFSNILLQHKFSLERNDYKTFCHLKAAFSSLFGPQMEVIITCHKAFRQWEKNVTSAQIVLVCWLQRLNLWPLWPLGSWGFE